MATLLTQGGCLTSRRNCCTHSGACSLLLRLHCDECASVLKVSTPPAMPAYSLIWQKTLGGLIYASSDVLNICRQCDKDLRGALVCLPLPFQRLVAKVAVATMTTLVGKGFFKVLNQHMLENHPHEWHSSHLMRVIIDKYLDVRLRYVAEMTTDSLRQKRIRQKHTELTQFKD